jgi:hypothetical protein
MEDPVTDLSDDARALLTRAKSEKTVDRAAIARVRGNVLRRVGVSAAASAVGTALAAKTAAAPSAPAAAAWLLAAKTLGGLVVVGAIAAGGVAIERQVEPAPAKAGPTVAAVQLPARKVVPAESTSPTPEPAPESVVAEGVPPPSVAGAMPAAMASPAPENGAPMPAPVAASPPVPRPAVPPPAPRAAASPSAASAPLAAAAATEAHHEAWAGDLALLRDAQAAIAGGDPRRARALAERVSRGGAFDDEREALLAVADCRASGDDAHRSVALRRADAFVQNHSGSPLAERVHIACSSIRASIP